MFPRLLSYLILAGLPFFYLSAEEAKPATKLPLTAEFPLPNPSKIGAERYSLLLNQFIENKGYENWAHDSQPRTTGPFVVNDSGIVQDQGIHGSSKVQVYYSPQVMLWLNNNRKGAIADGGMIVKVLFARDREEPTEFSEDPTGFSIMVKDSKGSWDGWFYSDGGPLRKPSPENALSFFDPNAGFATTCINCHATTDNFESTYSSLNNIAGTTLHTFETKISPLGLKKGLTYLESIHTAAKPIEAVATLKLDPSPYWPKSFTQYLTKAPQSLVPAGLDHVPQGPRPDGHRLISSSNCNACHNAAQLNSTQPNMTILKTDSQKHQLINLSVSSEWRHSAMGFSGRDPVFLSQLEAEREAYPHLADQIDNKCLSCHSPLGQRQLVKDKGPSALFTHDLLQATEGDPNAIYGALGRDGVSCVVCHQMSPTDLGEPSTFAGNFKLEEKLDHIYGPYKKVATLPMEQSLGLTPHQGTHLSDSKMCASCHTVVLPALRADKKYSSEEFGKLLKLEDPAQNFHEQTTYLEWQNSEFSGLNSDGNAKASCQSCHMPRTYKGRKLQFRIANIEDDTFPKVEHRADDALLHLDVRNDYARHTLHSINVFLLEMFRQHPQTLGISLRDNLLPRADAKGGFEQAIDTAVQTSREDSARIKITGATRIDGNLRVYVRVSNKSGHKFPTGITFRRAFVELTVRSGNKVIWASGETDKWGVIGTREQEKFTPLKSEFFVDNEFQPHHQIITKENQVQIYEQLVAASDGSITTSFLNVNRVIKDNRLLPYGWESGKSSNIIQPKFVDGDKDYASGYGSDLTTYLIPLPAHADQPITVTARLYYQALPPYYLKHRFDSAKGPATQRLYYVVSQLQLADTAISSWKLQLSEDEQTVDKQ